jgi:Membrane carboxypeptidase/penicillin-binding protein
MSPWDSIKYMKSIYQVGLLSVEPQTGFIKAWVGGVDFKHFKYDAVRQGRRQVGSTFKPFVYAAAIADKKVLALHAGTQHSNLHRGGPVRTRRIVVPQQL